MFVKAPPISASIPATELQPGDKFTHHQHSVVVLTRTRAPLGSFASSVTSDWHCGVVYECERVYRYPETETVPLADLVQARKRIAALETLTSVATGALELTITQRNAALDRVAELQARSQ